MYWPKINGAQCERLCLKTNSTQMDRHCVVRDWKIEIGVKLTCPLENSKKCLCGFTHVIFSVGLTTMYKLLVLYINVCI